MIGQTGLFVQKANLAMLLAIKPIAQALILACPTCQYRTEWQ